MRVAPSLVFGSLALVVAAVLPLACGAGSHAHTTSTTHGSGGSGNAPGSAGGGGGFGGGSLFGDAGDDQVVSIKITPGAKTYVVLNDVAPAPAQYTASGVTKNGFTVDVSGTWSYDQPAAATLNPGNGLFTVTGLVGAKGKITFTSGNLTATTTATVKLHYTSDPMMVPASVKTQFAQASAPDTSIQLLYPYDKTVFPRGLTGPTLQWSGGSPTDVYYIHALAPTFEFEAWSNVAPPAQYGFPTMPDDIWKKLTDSTNGNITVSVQRNDGTQAYLPLTRTWTVAPAVLTGTIYYWAVNAGNVMRLQPGSPAAAPFLQLPSGASCVACHSVSKNGSTLVASFNGGMSPWGSFDAASGANLYSSGQNSGFEAISPDGSHVLWGQWVDGGFDGSGSLTLSTNSDATSLATLSPGGGNPAYPAWSSDSKSVAFALRTDGNGLDFNTSSLWTTDVDLSANTFSNTHQIVASTGPQTATVYPTYSPDSKWIAFERCTHSRSRANQGDVWIVGADGSNPIALDQANGTGLLTGNEVSSTYEPTFMPVAVGGYFWLVIVSERTYGNTLTDTNPTTRVKQLWVTAIDATPMPGVDPSHPPFWLPGQDITTNNMRGEWALSPCKMMGETCTAGYDCCGGFCHDDGMGNLTCTTQGSGCSHDGEACKTASDCCNTTSSCIGGFCSPSMPN